MRSNNPLVLICDFKPAETTESPPDDDDDNDRAMDVFELDAPPSAPSSDNLHGGRPGDQMPPRDGTGGGEKGKGREKPPPPPPPYLRKEDSVYNSLHKELLQTVVRRTRRHSPVREMATVRDDGNRRACMRDDGNRV